MNINDLRANAYKKNSADSSKNDPRSDSGKTIKPFIPQQLSSRQMSSGQSSFLQQSSRQFSSQPFVQANIVSMTNAKSVETRTFSSNPNTMNHISADSLDKTLDKSVDYLKENVLLKIPAPEKQSPDGKDSIYRRIAKFLILIGDEQASKILPHLSETQIEKIIPEIATIRSIDDKEAASILEEFKSLADQQKYSGGMETAKDILERTYGTKKANEILQKSVPLEGRKPFEYLNESDNEKIYEIIKNENAGIKALILSHIHPDKAAGIISIMSDDEKKEVILRLAKMEKLQPDLVVQIDKAIYEKSLKFKTEQTVNINGMNALTQILRKMDSGTENTILKNLSSEDPELSENLRSRLFTIDDVIYAEDRIIQEELRNMSDSDVCYLLAGKPEVFRCKILDNISAGRRTDVFQQEAILKPMKKSDVERTTSQFLNNLRNKIG